MAKKRESAPSPKGGGKPAPKGAPRASGKKGAPRGMSMDRKLDVLGVVLVFIGLLTLLSFFSANRSPLLEAWFNIWAQVFGWGVALFPFGLIAAGLLLVLRTFGDQLPKLEPERVVGVGLLFLGLLAAAHFFVAPTDAELFAVAQDGRGGGVVGAFVLSVLFTLFGQIGSAVTLVAWLIIAVVFTAGLSVAEIVQAVGGLYRRVRGPGRQLPLPEPGRPGMQPAGRRERRPPAPGRAPGSGQDEPVGPLPANPRTGPHTMGTTVPAPPPPMSGVGQAAAPKQAAEAQGGAASPASLPVNAQPLVIGGDQIWELPDLAEMLEQGIEGAADDEFDRERVHVIEETLASFGAPVKVVEVNRGPTITQFGVEPGMLEQRGGKQTKVKVGKISALANDLALALAASSIRIEAPVPGKGYVGIEVPNTETALVALRDVMESEGFENIKSSVKIGLGQDVSGQAISADLANMPHLLVAGTTGSGKSVCVNSIIACLLIQNTPDDLKLLMIDPKRVELTGYNGIPHLLAPVVVDLDRVVNSLQWVTREMDERYRRYAKAGVRNIADYNEKAAAKGEKKQPFLVVIIDELADLMMLAPDETERTIARLAQMARATGIHLIIATQRPSVDVVTGLIKANFPARISFAVASSVDSRVVLDQPGAEKLLGRGDMLFQSPDSAAPLRMQGVFVSDVEIQRIVRYWKGARSVDEPAAAAAPAGAPAAPGAGNEAPYKAVAHQRPLWEEMQTAMGTDGEDELLQDAIQAVRDMRKASISLLQRRLRIGYTRAARLIDLLEEKGIVGPAQSGAQPREVLTYADEDQPSQTTPSPPRPAGGSD